MKSRIDVVTIHRREPKVKGQMILYQRRFNPPAYL